MACACSATWAVSANWQSEIERGGINAVFAVIEQEAVEGFVHFGKALRILLKLCAHVHIGGLLLVLLQGLPDGGLGYIHRSIGGWFQTACYMLSELR